MIITITPWFRTSRLPIKNSLSNDLLRGWQAGLWARVTEASSALAATLPAVEPTNPECITRVTGWTAPQYC